MKLISVLLLVSAWLNPGSDMKQASDLNQGSDPNQSPPKAPQQPIAFSHKQHANLGLSCEGCHPGTATRRRAGLPSAAECLDCHRAAVAGDPQLGKLAAYERDEKKVPWVRVYKVPYFVNFRHRDHAPARLSCETCHGPVAQREFLWKEKETSMKACVDCHKSSGATESCTGCHELNR